MIEFLKDYWAYIKSRKKRIFIPIFIIFLGLFSLIFFGGKGSVIAPFIYTLF